MKGIRCRWKGIRGRWEKELRHYVHVPTPYKEYKHYALQTSTNTKLNS